MVAVTTILIRSHWYANRIAYLWPADLTDTRSPTSWTALAIETDRGRLGFFSSVYHYSGYEHSGWFFRSRTASTSWDERYEATSHRRILGFGLEEEHWVIDDGGPSLDSHILFIPLWSLLIPLSLPLAVVTLRDRRQKRRRAAGLCPKCAYDLRASKEICPECGTPILPGTARLQPGPQSPMPPESSPKSQIPNS
jgi:hypothetical protein